MKAPRVLPPVYFFAALLSQFALDRWLPMAQLVQRPWSYLGVALVVVGLAPMVAAVRVFTKAQTTIKPGEVSSALVEAGPFRYSRNPMYVGMVTILTGSAIGLGSATPFVTIPLFAALIAWRFISMEERVLEETFGAEYVSYKQRVGRWF